jgi:HSP20 family protein
MNLSLSRKRKPLAAHPANGELARLRDEMDRTFDRFFSEPFGLMGGFEPKSLRFGAWIPALDVSETDAELTIRVELPGVAAKDLDISISGNTLNIAGEKDETTEKNEEDFYQCERRFGSFRRVIDLPESADANKVTADSENGVVTIHVAKKPSAKPKQVEVKPAGKGVAAVG